MSEKRQRTATRTIRGTPAEIARLDALAAAHGHSLAALVRHRLLDQPLPRRRRPPLLDLAPVAAVRTELGFLRGELGKIGSNVNQIAHQLNARDGVLPAYVEGAMCQLEESLRSFHELRDAVLQALGSEPAVDEEDET